MANVCLSLIFLVGRQGMPFGAIYSTVCVYGECMLISDVSCIEGKGMWIFTRLQLFLR